MATPSIIPRVDGEGSLGLPSKKWGDVESKKFNNLSQTASSTPNSIVIRDSSGNFSANQITSDLVGDVTGDLTGNVTGNVTGNLVGDVTGDVVGSISGNAATATKLATARTISLTGDVTGSASFNGSANAAITATVANDSHTHTGGNITSAVANATNAVSATTAGSCTGNSATATKLTTSRTISLTGGATGSASFDGSANTSIPVVVSNDSHTHLGSNITSAVANATNATNATNAVNATTAGSCTGNAATATKLFNSRTISLTGDVTGSAYFDGSANAAITATVGNDSHTHIGGNITSAVANATNATACSGNSATATKLLTARTLALSGDVTGSAIFDGTADSTIVTTVANDSHTHLGSNITSAVANATNATTASACSGNAATATKLATARTISLTGDVTGSASFNGSANASITATVADDSHNHTIANVDSLQTTLDGKVPTGRTVTAGNGLTGGGALSANITVTMGTPGSCSASSTNTVTSTSHTHAVTGFSVSSHTHSYVPIPTSSTLPVGMSCTCLNYGSTIADNSTIAGSSLRRYPGGAMLTGTWKNISGVPVNDGDTEEGITTYYGGLFVRTA